MRKFSHKRILSLMMVLVLCLQSLPATQVNASEDVTSTEVPVEKSAEEVAEEGNEVSVDALGIADDNASIGEVLAEGETGNQEQYVYKYGDNDSMNSLKQLLQSYHKTTSEPISWSEDGKLLSMPVDAGAQLILLSVTDPQVYQNTEFKTGSVTGAISLTDSVTVGTNQLTFQGLGSETYPFQGKFNNNGFTINRTLFNALDYSQAEISGNTVTVDWMGENSAGAIVALKLISSVGKSLKVIVNSLQQPFRDAAFGEISGDLDLTISFSNGIAFENKVSSNQNNAGMVANTVSDGTLSLTVSSFPQSITIGIDGSNETSKSNAGLLVGYLNNASLTLNGVMLPQAAVVQSAKGGAGGIVGRVDNSGLSTIQLNGNVDVSDVTVQGMYSGGIAGYAKDVAFVFGENKAFTLPESLGEKANNNVGSGYVISTYTGGIFGYYSLSHTDSYQSYDGTGFNYPATPITLHGNTSSSEIGVLFGHLELKNECGFSVSGTQDTSLNISGKAAMGNDTVSASGGLIGKLVGDTQVNELKVAYATVSMDCETAGKVKYLGGLVGSAEKLALHVKDVSITVPQPSANTYFGGLTASLGEKCVLKTEGNVTVSTVGSSSPAAIPKGGGLVGEAKTGSVVKLSGVTDLSNVVYTVPTSTSVYVGQLVGNQESTLIFATGSGKDSNWTYKRSTTAARVDDIGNYGQVIRLGGNLSGDLISIGPDNTVTFKDHGNYGSISSADDFALHAIAFSTYDVFKLYTISGDSGGTLWKENITLEANIDLTGTGIQGLMRDNYNKETDPNFAGNKNAKGVGVTFDGGDHTLTINTGEIYGMRGTEDASGTGSGQCYRHGSYGLLGRANSTIVQNLTISGTMNIGADVETNAGFVIGTITGGNNAATKDNTIQNVTVKEGAQINIDGTPPSDKFANVGGLIGQGVGADTGIVVQNSGMNAAITYTGTSDLVVLGGIMGKDTYKDKIALSFDTVTIGGIISSQAKNNAHVGSLISDIAPDTGKLEASMSLKNVVVNTAVSTSATVTSGGLLGYYWNDVDVTFDGSGTSYAVTTDNASLTTNGAAAGGLCFAATGRWKMQNKAVDMGSAAINTKGGDLGLLVCHGERQGKAPGQYSDTNANAKALYLVMDTEWDTAYKNNSVTVSGTPAVFDEIVAYTAGSYNGTYDITLNDAGIISLHTSGDKVNMTTGERNTYVNRTTYGKNHQTNPNSRYYYNLDGMEGLTTEGDVDSSEKLLIWSVRKYCADNIHSYLPAITSNKITGTLDMDGYSYYPVDIVNTDVQVQDATITFYNAEIEAKEAGNKSTRNQGSDRSGRSQHFTMHSGLFHHYYTNQSATQSATLTVNNLTLLGTVSMVESGSGALICGDIYGYGTNPVKLELNTLKVDSTGKHLSVAEFNTDYAPLLLNQVGSFANLNIVGVTAEETAAGATSLIGRVGDASDANTEGINLSFSKMKLPDKEGRFTKATMLHSLYYTTQNNSAVYNFTKEEDWNGTDHIYQVTYGKEIGGTEEYKNAFSNPGQYWYAQSETNVSHSGTKFDGEDRDSFKDYLPYVYQAYNADSGYHELQVNSSLRNITSGCGTYGDPYQISNVAELQSIASYLATGHATKEWTLHIGTPDTDGSTKFCPGDGENSTHDTFVYNGSVWVSDTNSSTTLTSEAVLTYLRNAYYQITTGMEVDNFVGFGTRANPFRGVVVGKTGNETITLQGKLPKGFIVCSYGSVVKDLNLTIEGETTISFTEIQDNFGYTSESYYGGVIGCILGGDNIIENVDVTYPETAPVTLVDKDASGKKKSHLIPVGGYVGVISGGGVIFRKDNALQRVPNSYVNNENYFYANPYIGRVLQGFAVQESGTKLDNTDKNYQICELDPNKTDSQSGILVENTTITLSDAQALLIFSSVTNSGGAGGGQLLSYFANARSWWNGTTFSEASVGGKVRNASYDSVGKASTDQDADYQLSRKDDYKAVSAENASYLDTHYAGGKLYSACGDTAYSINLTNGTYDMTVYGNGYRSISPRYLANAVCSDAITSSEGVKYKRLNPLISTVNGNGAVIRPQITVKEYVDDDHHAIAVGGVFNTVRFRNTSTIQDITIGGTADDSKGSISHEYYEWTNGSCADATHKNWNGKPGFTNLNYEQGRGLIGIGGFAGNNAAVSYDCNVTFQKVNTQYLTIKGPFDAGGIMGHTGLRIKNEEADHHTGNKNYHICYLTDSNTKYVVPTFNNCSYEKLSINGGMMVGGYLGFAAYNLYAPIDGSRNDKLVNVIFDEESDGKLGANSSITCQRAKTDAGIDNSKRVDNGNNLTCLPAVGGLFGCSNLAVSIDNDKRATIENVEVRSSRSAGGVIAWPLSTVTIKNLSVIGDKNSPNQVGDLIKYEGDKTKQNDDTRICEFAGGLIGYVNSGSKAVIIENCTVENLLVVASLRSDRYPCYAGGLVGDINSSANNHVIANCKVKNLSLADDNYNGGSKASYCGGLVARLENGNLYGANLLSDSIVYNNRSGDLIGNLFGGCGSDRIVYLAGVSIQNTQKLESVLQTDIGGTKPPKCYVAYADYSGAAQDAEQAGSVVSGSKEPYVTTSPGGTAIPIGAEDADGNHPTMNLYGDGADPSIVKEIYDERNKTDQKKFYYNRATGCSFESRYVSSFYAEMGLTEETAGGIPDFPVLQVPVSEKTTVTKQIVDYLNLVTNNGYATARSSTVGASEHVTSSIALYRWNEAGYFEKIPSISEQALSGGGDSFETSFTNYDSGKNQFELLTVTFTEPYNISGRTSYEYKIQVPIVVRRMLEVDFTATLKDSPSFKLSDYENYNGGEFKSNITVGYGVSVSALLTYTYNSAIGVAQTYGWQTYLNHGGFMGDTEQTIQFYNPTSKLKSLPIGTQLVLLDCADNNKAYSYKVSEQSETQGTNVAFSAFKDSGGSGFASRWLSEIMEVEAAHQSDTGEWVLLENSDDATARIRLGDGYQYFRPKTSEDTDASKMYHLTAIEGQPTEQFYLVIYIPDSSVEGIPVTSETEGKNLNGYISTTIPGLTGETACNINTVRVRSDNKVVTDNHSNTESTYNFLSGYTQSLEDNSKDKEQKLVGDPEAYILLDKPETDGNYLLHMDLVDEITIVKGQKDTAETPLYFKETISLPNYAKAGNDTVSLVTANGFPTGCYGTVEFYVYTDVGGTKTYYKRNGNDWVAASNEERALSYEWDSDGGNMELYLGTNNTQDDAVSLAAIRQLAKSGNEKFYVETKIDIHMSVPAAEQVIAGAITKGNAYTKLSYTTYLASDQDSFSSTNYVESKQGEVRYYQSRSGNSTMTHTANDPTQLGINCSDLASANGVIYTTGVYDLTTVSNAENLIRDADKVTYTLTLWQRQENGGYVQITDNLDKYIRSVRMNDHPVSYSGGYQWTDVRSGTGFASTDPQNSKRFLLPVRVQVNTDVETNGVTFANYQLRLTATLYKGDEILDQPINSENQIGGKTEYIRYDYVTYTITRILTSGYWGKLTE